MAFQSQINFSIRKRKPEKGTSSLVKAKQVFHTGLPSRLIGRSKEISDIHCFLSDHVNKNTSGSLYMSGAPGTGKTSSLMFVKNSIEKTFSFIFINCMTVNTPASIYKTIARELKLSPKFSNSKNIAENLKKKVCTTENPVVLVLDEIDHLDTKGQQVLYSIFEWPYLQNSKLILIGIANALDLTDRMLPLLKTFKYQPKLMHFQPYTKDEIVSIIEDRLSEIQLNSTPVIKPIAIQLCARKIAANTGDIRKALDVCRRAIEIVENKVHKRPALHSTSDDRCNPGSPIKKSDLVQCVDLQDINAVLHEVYGSRLQASAISSGTETVTMPLQHKLLLCTLILLQKNCKVQDMNLGKAYDTFKRICSKRNIALVGECAFHGLCKLVESRGFVQLRATKVPRLTKITMKLDENEAERILKDNTMLASILSDKTVLHK